jgi:NhaP-type Na+/H+ or K+/H+ antiporter
LYELFTIFTGLAVGAIVVRFVPLYVATWWEWVNRDLVGSPRILRQGEDPFDSQVRGERYLLFVSGMRIGALVASILFLAIMLGADRLYDLIIY